MEGEKEGETEVLKEMEGMWKGKVQGGTEMRWEAQRRG